MKFEKISTFEKVSLDEMKNILGGGKPTSYSTTSQTYDWTPRDTIDDYDSNGFAPVSPTTSVPM